MIRKKESLIRSSKRRLFLGRVGHLFLLTFILFGLLIANDGLAQSIMPPPGKIPSIQATEAEEPGKALPSFKPGDDGPAPRPNHPPIGEIPPRQMPVEPAPGLEAPTDRGPGRGVLHNSKTGETIEFPVESNPTFKEFMFGGGYIGADGIRGTEELPATFYDMSIINNTQDHPWRMNVKIVGRMGTSYYVCSGTMRDSSVVLTAGHCVYDYGGYGWADELWVYPGWDGNFDQWSPPPSIVNPYGYAHSTTLASWTGWTLSGDYNYDVGLIALDRAAGALTGWFGWVWGYDCDWHRAKTYNNASYPAENCGGGLHTGLDMYYWFGNFDSCPSWNRLQIDTSGGCYNAGWGGMSGSGAYYIDGDSRYVHGICSTSDRSTYARYARQWDSWVNYTNDTFIPTYGRGSNFDLQPLDVNANPISIEAGESTTLLNHLAVNATNGSANGTWTFRVYLSTNDNISEADTLLSTQNYSYNFVPMSWVTVNMVQVTIPSNTPAGEYWLGVIYDSATDSNLSNNDTDGWDPVPITVTRRPDLIVESVTTDPANPFVNENITVTVTIKNQGLGNAGSFDVDIYKDRATAPTVGVLGEAWCSYTSLAAGATTTCVRTVSYNSEGTKKMWAQADSTGIVTEYNETNNVYGPKTIPVVNPPDLIVQSIVTSPSNPLVNENITVTVTVKNQGTGNASGFYLDIYKDRATAPTVGVLGEEFCWISSLAAGATTTCVRTVSYNSEGTKNMWAQADSLGSVRESNETNNVYGPKTISVTKPVVSVTVPDATATEAGPTTGTFTVCRTESTAASLAVYFAMSGTAANGTDYSTITSPVTIPAGASCVNITLTPINDTTPECNETGVLTILANAAYTIGSPSSGTITILDNDIPIVTVLAIDATATEAGPTTGTYRISRYGCFITNLVVYFTMSGTAANGTDYATITSPVTILAGASFVDIMLTPINDALLEGNETSVVTLLANAAYTIGSPSSATITIIDDDDKPTVKIEATDPIATEAGPTTGTFTVSRTGPTTAALNVYYQASGTATPGVDRNSLVSPVTIPAGASSATITVTPINDTLVETDETVTATLLANAAYNIGTPSSATITIVSDD